jgi:hypothetical protein
LREQRREELARKLKIGFDGSKVCLEHAVVKRIEYQL